MATRLKQDPDNTAHAWLSLPASLGGFGQDVFAVVVESVGGSIVRPPDILTASQAQISTNLLGSLRCASSLISGLQVWGYRVQGSGFRV